MGGTYRKNQTNLFFSGLAIIAFGLWSALKLSLYLNTNEADVLDKIGLENLTPEESRNALIAVAVAVIVFSLLSHLFIGISAVRDMLGKVKVRAYIPFSVIYMCLLILSYVSVFVGGETKGVYDSLLVSLIIDMTSFIALVLIILSSQELKKIRGKQAEA